jgi:hypothetical protein
MINFKTVREKELWQHVATHLKKRGIDTVLVGGAVVSIYSEGAYKSGDLDLVLTDFIKVPVEEVMGELGFKKEGGRHYIHPDCPQLFIEFISGVLGIGEDTNITPVESENEGQIIKILGPTDSVKDRLASYIYFNARECLDQAILVAKAHPIDQVKIKKWCEDEGYPGLFQEFLAELQK